MNTEISLKSLKNERGVVLVVAILILAVLVLLGTTAVLTTTTDLRITRNYKTGEQAFAAAEAGLEEARARLRLNFTPATGATGRISDPDPTSTTWTAGIGGSGAYTSIQSALAYTVTMQHLVVGGSVRYWGDPDGNGIYEKTATRYSLTGLEYPVIYVATSTGTAAGASKTITAEITRRSPITAPAALYVESVTTIQGASTNVIGTDQCGGTSLPGVVTTLGVGTVSSTSGHEKVCGVTIPFPCADGSMDVVGSGTNIDVAAMVADWKSAANYRYSYTANTVDNVMNWGTPTMGATLQNPSSCSVSNIVYYNMGANQIKLAGGTNGCGILLVDGDLDVNGGFNWYGMVVVTGSITYSGGGNKNITGAVLSGDSVDADLVGGNANIVYCSTAISNVSLYQSLKKLSWRDS